MVDRVIRIREVPGTATHRKFAITGSVSAMAIFRHFNQVFPGRRLSFNGKFVEMSRCTVDTPPPWLDEDDGTTMVHWDTEPSVALPY